MHYWGQTYAGYTGHDWITNLPPFWAAAFGGIVLIAALWSLFWKGLALWHAGQRGQPWWFLVLLIINTLGILEIIYLFPVEKIHIKDLFKVRRHS